MLEYLVQQGQLVFVISWRNPDERHANWGFDAYAEGMVKTFDVVDRITGAGSAHVAAACSGGLLACLAAAHRAAIGQFDRLASLSLLITMIDQSKAGSPSAMINERTARDAVEPYRRKGYLDGRHLAEVQAGCMTGQA